MYFQQWLEAVEDERYAFKAIFMAGGPGSGKSFLSQKLFPDFLKSNSDNIQVLLAKLQVSKEPAIRNQEVSRLLPDHPNFHRDLAKAQRLSNIRCELWTRQGYPIVIDFTSRDSNLVSSINKKLKLYGYDTGMIFIRSSLEKAIDRNKKREIQGKHVAEESFLIDAWEKLHINIPIYREIFGEKFQEIDNEKDYEDMDRQYRSQFDRHINVVMRKVLMPELSKSEIIKRKELLCQAKTVNYPSA